MTIPAAVLAILGGGALLIDVYFAFTLVIDTLNYVAYAESHGQEWEFGRQLFAGSLAIVAAFLCHLVVLAGAISMVRGSRGRWARAAVAFALIPCLSPFIVAGIPFALWALVAMRFDAKNQGTN